MAQEVRGKSQASFAARPAAQHNVNSYQYAAVLEPVLGVVPFEHDSMVKLKS